MITLSQFFVEWNGKQLDNDGNMGTNPYGAQCVNVPNEWCRELGIEEFPGDAATFEYDSHPDCEWVMNTVAGVPLPGDIVVWRAGGILNLPFGHVDVFLDGNDTTFDGMDQNWPLGSAVHRQNHDYTDVAGWLHPRVLDQAPVQPVASPPNPVHIAPSNVFDFPYAYGGF